MRDPLSGRRKTHDSSTDGRLIGVDCQGGIREQQKGNESSLNYVPKEMQSYGSYW